MALGIASLARAFVEVDIPRLPFSNQTSDWLAQHLQANQKLCYRTLSFADNDCNSKVFVWPTMHEAVH